MMIDRPIFILGTGRSGTTLLYELLAAHPEVGWVSNYTNRFPRWPSLAVLSRIYDWPLGLRIRRSQVRGAPWPVEPYRFLNHITDSQFTSPGRLHGSDAAGSTAARFRASVETQLRWQGKRRFLMKHTRYARSEYLSAIFPDAMFIHIYRDGRAVANSMDQVDWWSGDEDEWRWGEMNPADVRIYEDSNKSSVVLAGISWKVLMDIIETETSSLPDSRYFRVRYDELVRDPLAMMDEVRAWCGLKPDSRFDDYVRDTAVSDMDWKWRELVSAADQRHLAAALEHDLRRHGFVD